MKLILSTCDVEDILPYDLNHHLRVVCLGQQIFAETQSDEYDCMVVLTMVVNDAMLILVPYGNSFTHKAFTSGYL